MNFFDGLQLASVGLFVLTLIVKTSYLLGVKKINPIAVRGKKGVALAFELIAFGGLFVWLLQIVLRATHANFQIFPPGLDPLLFDSSLIRIVGSIVIILAMVLFVLAFLSFGSSWRVGLDTQTPGALVTSGSFRLTRNPIFVSLDLWFIGILLINGTLIFLIFAVGALTMMHLQILREEKFMKRLYGDPYHEYVKRTARYLIW